MSRLEDNLRNNADSGVIPMHMPGHKRNTDFVPSYLRDDITEIDGFDNLHAPAGVLKDIETDAASIWGASSAVMSVNGATALLLSALMAASSRGKILIASNCHVAVWHALELIDAPFAVINPSTSPELPFCLDISPDMIAMKLDDDPEIKTVVITTPTYEGVVSDVDAIVSVAHSRDVAVIVDEAHGAHLGLDPYFPAASKADVVVKSIHKTLHAPTQTALLLTYGDLIGDDLIRHYMDVFESSSPSYILMEGIARVVSDLKADATITSSWVSALKKCRETLGGLNHLKLFSFPGADPSKLVILTEGVMNGKELADVLRTKKIEVEASFETHVIAMTGIGDVDAGLELFAQALLDVDAELTGAVSAVCRCALPASPLVLDMPMRKAVQSPSELVKSSESVGRTSASYCFKYPPGIPLLVPGQQITADRLELLGVDAVKVVCS